MNFNFIVATAIFIFISMYSIVADKPWESSIRLSPYIRPQQYYISLYPDLERGSFSGFVNITLTLDTAQSYIALHSKELNITETKLNSNCVTAFLYPKYEFLVVVPNEELSAGEYKLEISFEGNLLDKLEGFYRSSYNDSKSQEQRYLATSYFEPIYARQAFPCFDEPHLKAHFKITLTRPLCNNYKALSNMNQECEEDNVPTKGLTTVHFANTPPMSTYLVCLIVCDFKSLDPVKTEQGFLLTAYARSDQIENMKYAQEVGLKAINFYVKYFDIPYALPKLDLIAIPDFSISAMENWGIVTFRETEVFYKENMSSRADQKRVALTVLYELAEMWFGDSTTMKWWNDLWLKEGFANYISFKALEIVEPDWDADTLFLIETLQPVQNLDNKLSSHAIVQDVSNPDEIYEIMDIILYYKGASVLRMLDEALCEEVFRIGIIAYLKCFTFKNAETDDLWAELQIATHNTFDVKKFMDTWTRQAGFPMVTVLREGTKLILNQQRFLSSSNTNCTQDSSLYDFKWEILITYITSNDNKVTKFWFSKDNDSITVDIPDAEWIKLNYRQVGFYIVNYSESDWCLFSNLLENNVDALCAADRANLINDAFMLANFNYLSYGIAFCMTKYLPMDYHYVPWAVFEDNIYQLRNSLFERPALRNLEKYVQNLFKCIKKDFWNDSSAKNFLQARLRKTIISIGCLNGIPSYLTKVYELFKKFLYDNVRPHPDISYTVYNFGMAQGNECDWNKMWDLYLNEQEPQEKNNLMIALTASNDTSLLKKLLKYANNENNIRSQDYLDVLLYMCDNPIGNIVVWDFLRKEWECLVDRFSLNDDKLGQIIPYVCSKFNTCVRLKEMKEFFKKFPDGGAGEANRQVSLEVVSDNIKWLENHEDDINSWLLNH